MGLSLGPTIANIFMSNFESKLGMYRSWNFAEAEALAEATLPKPKLRYWFSNNELNTVSYDVCLK